MLKARRENIFSFFTSTFAKSCAVRWYRSPLFIFLRRLRLSSSARVFRRPPFVFLAYTFYVFSGVHSRNVTKYGSEECERPNPVFASGIGAYIVNVGVVTGHASHWFFPIQLFFYRSFSFHRVTASMYSYRVFSDEFPTSNYSTHGDTARQPVS